MFPQNILIVSYGEFLWGWPKYKNHNPIEAATKDSWKHTHNYIRDTFKGQGYRNDTHLIKYKRVEIQVPSTLRAASWRE